MSGANISRVSDYRKQCAGCGVRFVPHRQGVLYCAACLAANLAVAAAEVAAALQFERRRRGWRR